MSEWWTYHLSDFLMFAPRTYYRLFELYNADLWPLHLAMLALGLVALGLIWRDTYGRVVAAILAIAWLIVAWAYHWERFAAINTGAPFYALGFAIEALLLCALGVRRDGLRFDRRTGPVGSVGYAMLVCGLLYPLLAPAFGRAWMQAEVFGIAPDPTAIATLGVLLLASGRARWPAMVLPILWCAISAATLWTMDSLEALIPAGAAALGVVSELARSRRSPAAEAARTGDPA